MAEMNNVTIGEIEVLNQEFGYSFIIADGKIIGAVSLDDNGEPKYIF